MPPLKKKVRIMEYYIIYNIHNGSYFINKSQRPNVSVRHQFSRAYREERPDYNSQFSQDIRKYGEGGFIIRYSLEMPEWAERRAHYIVKENVDEAIMEEVKNMRTEPTPCEPQKPKFIRKDKK